MKNISILIADLKNHVSEGKSQSYILTWLNQRMSAIGIKMQYDEHHPAPDDYVSENQEYNEETPTFQMVDGEMVIYHADDSLKEHAPPVDGNFSYLETADIMVKRVILSRNRDYDYGESQLAIECNGIVLNAETWDVLSSPPRAFSSCTAEYINNNLDTYEFTQIVDGTMVTLYSWDHPTGSIWCISTSNGYDVSHLKWMGPRTYAELVFELLDKCPGFTEEYEMKLVGNKLCPGDTRLDFGNLDSNCSYSFTFRSHYYHPLLSDSEGIWSVQTVNLKTRHVSPNLDHVPGQTSMTYADMCRHIGKTKIQVSDIDAFNNGSLAYMTDNSDSPEDIDVNKINYGFILRATTPNANGCYKDILVDSDLLKQVRRLIYKYPNTFIRDSLNASNRMDYFIMKACLVPPDRKEFLSLFPYYKFRFDNFDILMNSLITHIIFLQQIKMMSDNTVDNAPEKVIINPKMKSIDNVSKSMLAHILKNEPTFNPMNANAQKVVREYVTRSEYAMMFMHMI